ncbi:MAG: orotate phosphoribosyltransferase [Ardenticatenales bacterium]
MIDPRLLAEQPPTPGDCAALAEALHRIGAVQFGTFTLKSGATSPVYCDLRLMASDATVLAAAAEHYAALLAPLSYDRIAAIPYAGLPIGTAVSLRLNRPLIFPRKEVKAYGRGRAIEGAFTPGETVVVIDDLVSSGLSKIEAIAPLAEAGLIVHDIAVLIDRRGADATDLGAAGFRLHAAFTLPEIAAALAANGRITSDERAAIDRYLTASQTPLQSHDQE